MHIFYSLLWCIFWLIRLTVLKKVHLCVAFWRHLWSSAALCSLCSQFWCSNIKEDLIWLGPGKKTRKWCRQSSPAVVEFNIQWKECKKLKKPTRQHSHPHLEKVVPCPPASESLSPRLATKKKKRGEEVRAAPKIRRVERQERRTD